MLLRCTIDGLLLPADLRSEALPLVVFDGNESFNMQWLEAAYYELVAASDAERREVLRCYRLLHMAADFRAVAA